MKITLGTKLFIAMLLGVATGVVLGPSADFFKPFGDLFVRLMQLIMLPLVLATITTSMFQSGDMRSFGRIGGKTLLYFAGCTAAAVCVGLLFAQIFQPGENFSLIVDTSTFTAPKPASVEDMLLGLISPNVFQSLSNGRVIEVIVFALLFGTAIQMSGEKGIAVKSFFTSFSDVMISFVHMVIGLTPYGVFCLIASTAGNYGIAVILPLFDIVLVLTLASIAFMVLVYIPILKLNKFPIGKFYRAISQPAILAFSSALSAAAMPLSLKAQENLGVSEKVRNFVIPLGMTANMNGTAIYFGICATFVANVYGIELSMTHFLTIVITGVLGALGASSVPLSGLVMLTMVLTTTGLPIEGIALIAGVEYLLGMIRTVVNVVGDNVTSVAVASSENEIFEVPTNTSN